MSAEGGEYSKRTCLICGCHTNQTINIYEPRSGPNIVHLIQAKFKFQPLSDDKFLCYGCNNWLINWHSLQAANSNDTKSPAGKNPADSNVGIQDKIENQLKLTVKDKPIARVSPRISNNVGVQPTSTQEVQQPVTIQADKAPIYIMSRTLSRTIKIMPTFCQNCKRKLVMVAHKNSIKTIKKCKKCRKSQNESTKSIQKSLMPNIQNLVYAEQPIVELLEDINTNVGDKQKIYNNDNNNQSRQFLPRPTLDGKLVSKLRRLGTTVEREINGVKMHENKGSTNCEMRQMDDDEILLDFNTAISEVISIEQSPAKDVDSMPYQISFNTVHDMLATNNFDSRLPKALTISLVSEE